MKVGKYLASQSDDKSLRIWKTVDWTQEAVVTEPFEECGGKFQSTLLCFCIINFLMNFRYNSCIATIVVS